MKNGRRQNEDDEEDVKEANREREGGGGVEGEKTEHTRKNVDDGFFAYDVYDHDIADRCLALHTRLLPSIYELVISIIWNGHLAKVGCLSYFCVRVFSLYRALARSMYFAGSLIASIRR